MKLTNSNMSFDNKFTTGEYLNFLSYISNVVEHNNLDRQKSFKLTNKHINIPKSKLLPSCTTYIFMI